MAVRDQDKQRVLDATDIVRIIGEQVALRPKGRELAGLCPFHDDKNPSMYVSPVKQIYKCFSCGAGGDVFSFVMNYHKMTFREALEHLAERAGIPLSRRDDGDREAAAGRSMRQRIATVNELAQSYYRRMLEEDKRGESARSYINGRGMNEQVRIAFQLGYSPDSWDELSRWAMHHGWDMEALESSGLVIRRKEGGGCYDRFRHRLIFPICDAVGRVIAFGGRKLRAEDEPKYLNSPETALFDKSVTLYGLHQAKKSVISTRTAVVVEGYTDVIAAHQSGAMNVVATLGTALTGGHVSELRRYADKVVLVFDGDEAGQKAADRAVEIFLAGEVDVSIAILPEGRDPADLFSDVGGLEQWETVLAASQDAMTYQFDRMRNQLDKSDTVTGRQKLVEMYLSKLSQLGLTRTGTLRRSLVVQQLSAMLHMSETGLNDLLSQYATVRPRPLRGTAKAGDEAVVTEDVDLPVEETSGRVYPRAVELAERQIIGCLLRENELFHSELPGGGHFDELVLPGDFMSPVNREIYEQVYSHLGSGETISLGELLSDYSEDGRSVMSELLTQLDFELDRTTGGEASRISELFEAAVLSVIHYGGEQEYRRRKASLMNGSVSSSNDLDALLEHRRMNPSPVRIARV